MAKKAKSKSVIEQLQDYNPPWVDSEAEEKKDADANEGLVARLAKVEAELAEARRQQAYQGFTNAAPTATSAAQQPSKPAEIDLSNLPDPVSNPTEYAAELIKRQQAAVDARLAAERTAMAQANEQANLAQKVWDGFKSAQPSWAKHELLVQAVASKVSNDMAGRGVDVVRVLKQQPDLFYSEVTGMLEKQYPQLKVEKEDDGDDDGDTHRTAGVFGGTPGKAGNSLESGANPDDNEAFLRSLAEVRYKAGVR